MDAPHNANQLRATKPVICYEVESLPPYNKQFYEHARRDMVKIDEVRIEPRSANIFTANKGCFFRITSIEGSQVGDLNLWHANNLSEHFFSGKTRQLHASHVTTGHYLWSNMPYLRPMATITYDSLHWYGVDADGGSVHDVIGTRCDPYTNYMLKEVDYDYCCHSNLTRAMATYLNISLDEAEHYIHDVMNVFMCTGFTSNTHQYFMKASPVRPGDYIEFFAEIDILGALSACPGGNCGSTHSDDATMCYPLLVEVFQPKDENFKYWQPFTINGYGGNHGA